MRILLLALCLSLLPMATSAKTTKAGPFTSMYPEQLAPAADSYFAESNKVLFKDGPIATKEARLTAISASAAMKCEYCISAQVALAKVAGATADQIKAAIQIAAEVSRFSILLYGNEFGQDNLKKVVDKMIKKPAKPGKKATKTGPFYALYPRALAPAAEAYFGEWNKVLFKKGPIDTKSARLAAISASAAMKCEYCITAQVALAKVAGATDDQIKAATQIAADVGRFSILLYGNEYGQDNLNKVIKKMTSKPAKK